MNSNSNNAAWNDFNDAEEQREFALIPPKTLAKVIMSIRPGGYDDASQGWTGGYPSERLTLSQGDAVEIAGQSYRVREVRQIRDGSESVATLSRL